MSNSSTTKKTKWTILFIVHAVVEDTRVYSEKLFAELLEANIDPDKVQVFVLHDTYDYAEASKVHATFYEIKRNEKEDITDSSYASKENVAYSNIRCRPYDLGSISISDEEGLNRVLKEVEKRIESADKGKNITRKRILVTWDHSNGFGFFDTSQTDLGIQIKKSSRRPDMLMVTELEKAIKNCVPNGRIEILIMMHCWMQNIEAAYQLKDVVKILIGAETVFDFQGYDFTNLVNSISATALEIDEEELATQILDDIPKKLDKIEHRPSEEIFVSATKPEYSGLIKEQIDLLAGALREELLKPEENLRKILEARASCFEITKVADGYTPWYFVDIFEAIKKLESKDLVPKQISDKIDYAFKQYIIKNQIIKVTPLPEQEPPADFENFKGVSICFPYQNDTFTIGTIYKTYYSAKSFSDKKIGFAKDSKWPDFLDDLLTEVRNTVRDKANKIREDNEKNTNHAKRKSPTETEIVAIVDKILSPVVKRQNLTLELTINFDMIESQFLVNSVVANCTGIDESGDVTLFKTYAGDPKRGVPGGPKRGVPGDPKRGVPGDPKRGVPGELLSPDPAIEFREEQSKTQKEYLETLGIKL